jgi:hypothetical protein
MSRAIRIRALIVAGLLIGALLVTEGVAIVVAPTAVYMNHRSPSASVTLFNPGTAPEEVSVEAVFGHPATDEEGNLYLYVSEDPQSDPRSAAPWIQAFPRRVVVAPGTRQIIRIVGRPPADLPDGEYWSRLVFTSRGQQIPVAGVPDTADIRVGLRLEVRTVIASTYRKGEVQTGVRIEGLDPVIRPDSLVLMPRLVQEGNAAYIGRLEVRLEDPSGATAAEWQAQVAVYRELQRRLAWDVSHLPAGSYTLRLRLSTDRDDIPREHRLATEPVERALEVVKP